jgi:O-antigen/teichoic acid export membrane protein
VSHPKTITAKVTLWVTSRARDRLVRNLGWYGLGEVVVRLSRLVTTVILARLLLPVDFGIAAIAITAFELVRVLSNNGIGLMIVRATADQLERTCATAYRIGFLVAATMITVQLIAGAALAAYMARPEIFAMLAALALSYGALPFTEVRYCRILRAQRMRTLAGINTSQVLTDNILTALLAIAGFGAWAVVLPKLFTVPLYLWQLTRAEPWRPVPNTAVLPWAEVQQFSLPVLGAEILASLRSNLDKVLVGAILGVEALGIYAFAFNAGVGISLSLTAALSASLYPHLAEVGHHPRELLARFDYALRTTVAPLTALIAAQALLATVYVPLVFGERWAFAAPLVAWLCLSVVAKPLFDAAGQVLRARGTPKLDLAAATVFTLIVLSAFAAALPSGLALAIAVLALTSLVGQVTFVVWARTQLARTILQPSGAVA